MANTMLTRLGVKIATMHHREHEARDGLEQLGEPHDGVVDPAAQVTRDRAQRDAEHQRRRR